MPRKRRPTPLQPKESFGARLARLRKERGITQVDLAAKLRISQSNVSDYERDNLRLHADIIVAIAQILKVSADQLLGLEQVAPTAPVTDVRLAERITQISKLPRRDRDALMRTISAFLERTVTDQAA